MSGRIVTICGKRDYSLQAPTSAAPTIEIERYIPTSDWVSGALLVRLHAKGTWATNTTVDVIAQNISPSLEEAGTIFSAGTVSSIQIVASDNAPKLFIAALSAPISSHLRLYLKYTQDNVATTASTFTISIELVGRDA